MLRSVFATAGLFALFVSALHAQNAAQQNPGQKGTAQSRLQSGYGGISQQPWYMSEGVRQQLKLNEDQTNRLNKAWKENWTRYNTQIGQLSDVPQAQQHERRSEYLQSFNKGFGTASQDIFTPEQRRRYEQLNYQYQGSNAFSDPTVQQRLNLTDEQKQKLRQHQQEMFGDGKSATTSGQWRQRDQKWMNSFLTEQQRGTWRELAGEQYDFGRDSGTQNNDSKNQNQKQ